MTPCSCIPRLERLEIILDDVLFFCLAATALGVTKDGTIVATRP